MQIWYRGGDRLEIKTKQSTILLDSTGSKVNDVALVGPGEYEIGDVEVHGIAACAYLFKVDDLKLFYANGVAKLSQQEVESLGDVDVLLVPATATELINLIDPRVVIPYGVGLDQFCKTANCPQPVPSAKIQGKDIPESQRQTIILQPTRHD